MKDVARLAGVSAITVSRALSDSPACRVRPETRERVLRAARELNYEPNIVARDLKKKRSRVVAVIIPNLFSPYFHSIIEGVERVLDEYGYSLIIYNSNGNIKKEMECLRALRQRLVPGFVIIPVGSEYTHLEGLSREHTPLVFVDATLKGVHADAVVIDNRVAVKEAVDHLIERGYHRIALLACKSGMRSDEDRIRGYQQALLEAGSALQESLVRYVGPPKEEGYSATMELMGKDKHPDALFAAGTLLTIGAFQALKDKGYRIPKDVALAGYGDPEYTSILTPSLTIVERPSEQLGVTAAKMLLDRIEKGYEGPEREEVLAAKLVVREST